MLDEISLRVNQELHSLALNRGEEAEAVKGEYGEVLKKGSKSKIVR